VAKLLKVLIECGQTVHSGPADPPVVADNRRQLLTATSVYKNTLQVTTSDYTQMQTDKASSLKLLLTVAIMLEIFRLN